MNIRFANTCHNKKGTSLIKGHRYCILKETQAWHTKRNTYLVTKKRELTYKLHKEHILGILKGDIYVTC